MRAVRLVDQREALVEVELPDPEPDAGEVVVDVRAAGLCHSDAHYRTDDARIRPPITLGHEVAGVVAALGAGVEGLAVGDRVALHYLMPDGAMLGKDRDGGWAERIVVPASVCVPVPDAVPLEQAAIMMCSTATALHALRVAPLRAGDAVAILGFGGLGVSALQLARRLGASRVHVVEPVASKRELAASLGGIPSAVGELAGVDVVLDFAGHEATTLAGLRALAPGGRLVLVAINLRTLTFDPFVDVLCPERHITGSSDHTREELVELLAMAARGELDLSRAVSRRLPLAAGAVDGALGDLMRGTAHLRSVIVRE